MDLEVINIPKRNKLPLNSAYTESVQNPEKILIKKSNPLQFLSHTSMTLPELKILDAYLARVNIHEPDKHYIRLENGELEKLLGVTRILKKDLDARLNNLFQNITIQDETKINGFKKFALFEEAEYKQDENGLWQVNLMCTDSAVKYIFNTQNIEYLKQRLKNVINLTSRYSYILYLCLEDKYKAESSRKWLTDLDGLKKMLNCTAKTYKQYKRFNDLILKKCQKEINRKTTISFTYRPIKHGCRIVAVEFDIKKSQEIEITDENSGSQIMPVASAQEQVPASYDEMNGKYHDNFEDYCDNDIRFLAGACNYEFNESQMKELYNIISCMHLPYHPYGEKFSQYHYLSNEYIKLKKYAEYKEMDNKQKFLYLRKMLENDKYNR